MINVRPATVEDVEHFADGQEIPTMIAWVAEQDGALLGLGGFCRVRDRWLGFCNFKPELLKHKVLVMREALKAMRFAQKRGMRFIYAEVGTDEYGPNAGRWLDKLGFSLDPRTQQLYRWKNNGSTPNYRGGRVVGCRRR